MQNRLKPELREKLKGAIAELGLAGFEVPQEHGGLGLGLLAKCVVWGELGRTIALPSRANDLFGPNVSPILYELNEAQKQKYLLPTLHGELKWCFCQTEPDAGGDPGAMRTTAVRQGDHYVINGVKRFITQAGEADYAQVIAATDRAKGSHAARLIVAMNTPGVKLLRQQELVIDDRPWEVAFEDVRVPVEAASAKRARLPSRAELAQRRPHPHGARAIGVIERCLELGVAYAKQRVTFGQPLAERQAVQWMLADAFTDLHQLRLHGLRRGCQI